MPTSTRVDASGRLASAIHERDLCQVAAQLPDSPIVIQARRTCATIGRELDRELAPILERMSSRGLSIRLVGPDVLEGRQAHQVEFALNSAEEAQEAAEVLRRFGYVSQLAGESASWELHRRVASRVTLRRPGSVMVVVDLTWPSPNGWLTRLPRALRPGGHDYDLRDLPSWSWPVYVVLRPFRLTAERLGLRARLPERLGPFLSTPEPLVGPLLDLAEVQTDDLVIDIGCGDGRLVIEAARQRGCRARGVENNAALVRRARANVLEAGVAELVDIVEGDGTRHHVEDATVVFLYLAAPVAADLVGRILPKLRPGARVIAHEQRPVRAAKAPDVVRPIFGPNSVSVGHRWNR